jgi:hypothetical protein
MAVAGGVAAVIQDACSGLQQGFYIAAAYRVAATLL